MDILLQKQHKLLRFQFLLTKVSLVKMASIFMNHKNTSIFKGNFVRQISCVASIPLLTRTRYRHFTMKVQFSFKGNKIESLPACNLTSQCMQPDYTIPVMHWYHIVRLSLIISQYRSCYPSNYLVMMTHPIKHTWVHKVWKASDEHLQKSYQWSFAHFGYCLLV